MAGPAPIVLLADSQLLFVRPPEGLLLSQRLGGTPGRGSAAYLGASNGDNPAFYDLFVAAMDGVAIHDCRMIPSAPTADDRAFVDRADLLLLSGGDVERGLTVFAENGLRDRLIARYFEGAQLIGVSAGAIQLGRSGSSKETNALGLVPWVIDVHAEPSWERLRIALALAGDQLCGLGIPTGGGAIVHQDRTVEPVRRPLIEWSRVGSALRSREIQHRTIALSHEHRSERT